MDVNKINVPNYCKKICFDSKKCDSYIFTGIKYLSRFKLDRIIGVISKLAFFQDQFLFFPTV